MSRYAGAVHSTKPSHLLVPPHPGRKAGEGRLVQPVLRPVADKAIDMRGVRPVGLDRDDGEPMLTDQPLRDLRPCPVELRRAMARLAQQHDSPVGDPVEHPANRGSSRPGRGSAASRIKSTVSAGRVTCLPSSHGRRSAARRRRSQDPRPRNCLRPSAAGQSAFETAPPLPTGMTSRPPVFNCRDSVSGISGPPAVTMIASNGASSGQPSVPSPLLRPICRNSPAAAAFPLPHRVTMRRAGRS